MNDDQSTVKVAEAIHAGGTVRIGDIAEIAASLWLMRKGYEVFRNMSRVGPADLIARHSETGQIIVIDVKGISRTKLYRRTTDGVVCLPFVRKPRDGIHILGVIGDEVVGFVKGNLNTRANGGPSHEIYWPD